MNEGRGGAGEGETRESLASEKEMGIIEVKGKSFRKNPIQEYGKRATFASFVPQATNALPTLYLVFMTFLTTSLSSICACSPTATCSTVIT